MIFYGLLLSSLFIIPLCYAFYSHSSEFSEKNIPCNYKKPNCKSNGLLYYYFPAASSTFDDPNICENPKNQQLRNNKQKKCDSREKHCSLVTKNASKEYGHQQLNVLRLNIDKRIKDNIYIIRKHRQYKIIKGTKKASNAKLKRRSQKEQYIYEQINNLKILRISNEKLQKSKLKTETYISVHFPTSYYKPCFNSVQDDSLKNPLSYLEGIVNHAAKYKNLVRLNEALSINQNI